MPRWSPIATIGLGVWLVLAALTREDAAALWWSDVGSGTAIAVLGVLSFRGLRGADWAAGAVGLWVMFAPLAFWARTAAAYSVDTLIGSLVVLCALVLPRTLPTEAATAGDQRPAGWTYNPSDWSQRLPIVALAMAGFFMARLLAAYQLRHVDTVFEPFFGDGTRRILESDVSRAFPVSDAGLGALSYLIDALAGLMGGTARWRTMPWIVVLFGILIVPPGVTSIVLVILQPLAVGAWCTLCLTTALVMLFMVAPALDEVVASLQFLSRSRRAGLPFWRTLWHGGPELTAPAAVAARRPTAPGFGVSWTSSARPSSGAG